MVRSHLEEYKKKFKQEIKRNKICKNNNWKKRWLPFIKYDHDFDGIYFLKLIIYKLHILLDFYENEKNCMQVDKSRLEIINSLKEACRLGQIILDDKFEDKAFEFSKKHSKRYEEESTTLKDAQELIIKWDSEENKEKFYKMLDEAEKLRNLAKKEFFNYLAENYELWCD